jgi:hypothetical protein
MIRLRRWSVPGGLVVLTALVLYPVHELKRSSAAQKAADTPDEQKWMLDRSLTLTPQSEPVPALQYRLYPLASELKEGNAVPIYLRLVHERNDATKREWREKPAEWNKLPLDQLPIGEARKWLDRNSYMMKQLELGARRRTAEWDYTLDAGDPIGILLPDAQFMRVYGGILVLKTRVEIAEGNYAAAADTLQTGFAFCRQITEGPFLINGLVGIAIASQLADTLLDWVERADAPNLYWSLTALPRPLLDLRKEMEFERRMVQLQFPDLADLKRERTPGEWDATLRRFRTQFQPLLGLASEGPSQKLTPLPGAAPTDPAANSPELPEARKYLVERMHMPAAKVEAMPPAQVLLLHIMGVNDEFQDDNYKGAYLPPEQGIPVMEAAQKRLKSAPDTEATRVPRLFVAAVNRVVLSQTRLERKLAALRMLEALRLHAAAHDGQLPAALADLTEVPVPTDPATGQPFEYRRENETATLIAPPLNLQVPKTGLRYRAKLRKQ